MSNSVLLPQPLGPMTETNRPSAIVPLTSLIASVTTPPVEKVMPTCSMCTPVSGSESVGGVCRALFTVNKA